MANPTPAQVAQARQVLDLVLWHKTTHAACESHDCLTEQIEAIAAALATAHAEGRQAGEWQPASTAPQDGSVFRAYGPSLVHEDFNPEGSVEACFDGERFIGAVWDGQHDIWNTVFIEFTHWHPIPFAPVATEARS